MGMTYIKSESLSMQRMNMIQAREPRWLHSSCWNFRQSLGKIKIENQMLGFFFFLLCSVTQEENNGISLRQLTSVSDLSSFHPANENYRVQMHQAQFLYLPLESVTPKESIFSIIFWVFTIPCQVKITVVRENV